MSKSKVTPRWNSTWWYSHFADEKTEAQSGCYLVDTVSRTVWFRVCALSTTGPCSWSACSTRHTDTESPSYNLRPSYLLCFGCWNVRANVWKPLRKMSHLLDALNSCRLWELHGERKYQMIFLLKKNWISLLSRDCWQVHVHHGQQKRNISSNEKLVDSECLLAPRAEEQVFGEQCRKDAEWGHEKNSGPGGKAREQKMKRWKAGTLGGYSSPLDKVVEIAFVSPLSPQIIFFL